MAAIDEVNARTGGDNYHPHFVEYQCMFKQLRALGKSVATNVESSSFSCGDSFNVAMGNQTHGALDPACVLSTSSHISFV